MNLVNPQTWVQTTGSRPASSYRKHGPLPSAWTRQRRWLLACVPHLREPVAADRPNLVITQYEVWSNKDNQKLFTAAGKKLGFTASSVPTTVIGERVWIGWTDPIADDIAKAVELVAAGQPVPKGLYGTAGAGTCSEGAAAQCKPDDGVSVDVPLVGEVSLGDKSLLISTVIIGFVDRDAPGQRGGLRRGRRAVRRLHDPVPARRDDRLSSSPVSRCWPWPP